MSRKAERKRHEDFLNLLRGLYPVAGIVSFSAVITTMIGGFSRAYAAAACCLGAVAACGPVLAYFVKKFEAQEAKYNGPKKKDTFEHLGEKSLIEQARPLISRVRKYLVKRRANDDGRTEPRP
jgi:hypothetical protein